MKNKLGNLKKMRNNRVLFLLLGTFFAFVLISGVVYAATLLQKQYSSLTAQLEQTTTENTDLSTRLEEARIEIEQLKAEDQRVKNDQLQALIKEIEASFRR